MLSNSLPWYPVRCGGEHDWGELVELRVVGVQRLKAWGGRGQGGAPSGGRLWGLSLVPLALLPFIGHTIWNIRQSTLLRSFHHWHSCTSRLRCVLYCGALELCLVLNNKSRQGCCKQRRLLAPSHPSRPRLRPTEICIWDIYEKSKSTYWQTRTCCLIQLSTWIFTCQTLIFHHSVIWPYHTLTNLHW